MNYQQCMHCGLGISYPRDVQCRNDVLAALFKEGWKVHIPAMDDDKDEWYCDDCVKNGHLPASEFEIPSTVEYRGFTITFQRIHTDTLTGYPKLRCQIREDEDYFQDSEPYPSEDEEAFNSMVKGAKSKIDLLYDFMYKLNTVFDKMITKQVRRNFLDKSMGKLYTKYINQMKAIDDFFTNKKRYYRKDYTIHQWFDLMKSCGENLPSEYCDIFDRDYVICDDYYELFNVYIYEVK